MSASVALPMALYKYVYYYDMIMDGWMDGWNYYSVIGILSCSYRISNIQ